MCSGQFLTLGKAISDVGAGGMITLSEQSWSLVSGSGVALPLWLVRMGSYQLGWGTEEEDMIALYQALPTNLCYRYAAC